MSEPIKLVTTKSDKEIAEELKKELIEAAQPWLEVCTKAQAAGFNVSAQFGTDWFGKASIVSLSLTKSF